ncbi:helix-turn-helix transcriptional regulator [Mycobacterium colombiense]|uniref:helix-turn-helix transcriptional regulator n=1 Tax=Mycobacterium colombiense TaxID=339268 RepID=UPI00080154BC|nr:helix-turn-helix transcriptional regulator [Mycobacterium colombiense]OBJ79169.1 transcriptional regulator [Mycobacterium colombiense]
MRDGQTDDGHLLGGITLAQFLRARRSLVRPADVGLPAGGRRRVAGLRREEVAVLAGISTDYYRRLEQGQEDNPSNQVLGALGRALQLDDDAVAYMRNLVHHSFVGGRVDLLQRPHSKIGVLLDSWPLTIALLVDPGMTVVSANKLAEALCPHYGVGANTVRAIFLEPEMRHFYRNWERLTAWSVSFIRAILGQRPDPALIKLVDELTERSLWFQQLWARHDVTQKPGRMMLINHPQVGPLDLNYQQMLLPGTGHWLFVYWAAPGSASDAGLRHLASG